MATKLILILSTWGIAIAPPAIAQSTQPATPERQIQVYFPKMPESRNNLDYVEPVTRTTDRVDVADFALEQLAQGPDSSEQAQGFVDPLDFQGTSAAFCRDRNFRIGIVDDLAYVQFCRTVESAGIGDDARIQSAVRETLKQFSTVDSVLLLTQNGDCWPGLS
ncbi:MAG: GerMN domain-containing protein, partial [Spirulinaceae cyanobacterium]